LVVARGSKLLGLGAILALASGAAQAEDLDKGKSAPALFAASCAACHSSPRGLARDRGSGSLASYLQEHYTSGPQTAATLAAYLIANPGSAPRGKQQPAGRAVQGAAKQGEPKSERQPEPPQTATMRPDALIEPAQPRRPGTDTTKGKGKRQQTKQEAPAAPAAGGAEPAAAAAPAAPAAPTAPPAAPVAAAPPPQDQPAFSAPSP
jgi:hypothetical protein